MNMGSLNCIGAVVIFLALTYVHVQPAAVSTNFSSMANTANIIAELLLNQKIQNVGKTYDPTKLGKWKQQAGFLGVAGTALSPEPRAISGATLPLAGQMEANNNCTGATTNNSIDVTGASAISTATASGSGDSDGISPANHDGNLMVLSRKKRVWPIVAAIMAALPTLAQVASVTGLFVSSGFAIKRLSDDQKKLTSLDKINENQRQIESTLKELTSKMGDIATTVISTVNDFETRMEHRQVFMYIGKEVNVLKTYVDYLKETKIDANGNYGPSTIFGHGRIPEHMNTLELALRILHRYMTEGDPVFGSSNNLIDWYAIQTNSPLETEDFRIAMILQQVAGWEFLKILFIASCQQKNPDTPVGYCHGHEADRSTTRKTDQEQTWMQEELNFRRLQCDSGWKSHNGNGCQNYGKHKWCKKDGDRYGSRWNKKWKNFEKWADSKGRTALVCPQCGCDPWYLCTYKCQNGGTHNDVQNCKCTCRLPWMGKKCNKKAGIIDLPSKTGFGEWGPIEYCPFGSYAKNIQIKASPNGKNIDGTGLNSIALQCGYKSTFKLTKWIYSTKGIYGPWLKKEMCNGGFIRQARLHSEPHVATQHILSKKGNSMLFTEKLTWNDARKKCQENQGDLLILDKPNLNKELEFLFYGQDNSNFWTGGSYIFRNIWIGASDQKKEGTFVWIDGQPLKKNYFKGNNPNNWRNQDCVVVNWNSPGEWDDQSCKSKNSFLCTYGDTTAANNVQVKCTGGETLGPWKKSPSLGSWDGWRGCGYNQAVCGIQTMVQKPQGRGDDTSLNDVRLYCCDL